MGLREEREHYIDANSFPDLHKAALWLLAWSCQDPSAQRRAALEALAYVGEAEG